MLFFVDRWLCRQPAQIALYLPHVLLNIQSEISAQPVPPMCLPVGKNGPPMAPLHPFPSPLHRNVALEAVTYSCICRQRGGWHVLTDAQRRKTLIVLRHCVHMCSSRIYQNSGKCDCKSAHLTLGTSMVKWLPRHQPKHNVNRQKQVTRRRRDVETSAHRAACLESFRVSMRHFSTEEQEARRIPLVMHVVLC